MVQIFDNITFLVGYNPAAVKHNEIYALLLHMFGTSYVKQFFAITANTSILSAYVYC